MSRERLLGDVTAGGHLGHSDYQMIDFFQAADLVLLMRLAERVLWAILKGKGVQEGCTCFKEDALKVQEQTVHMFQKMSQWARRPTCLNKELWLELTGKKKFKTVDEGTGNSGSVKGCCDVVVGQTSART